MEPGGNEREFVTVFAPCAKKNATHAIEQTLVGSSDVVVARVLGKNGTLASTERSRIHRVGVVLVREDQDRAIALMHATPVQPA